MKIERKSTIGDIEDIMSIEIEEIKKMNINNGDVIIIKNDFEKSTTDKMNIVKTQREVMGNLFPNNKCLIIDKNTDIEVMTKEKDNR